MIITTYNRSDALAAVLRGFKAQNRYDFEVIIADDGSVSETAEMLAKEARGSPFSLSHVWQEDRGFRAAAIRNKALARARGDYIIFVDGDCIPRPDFVAAHLRLAEKGWFVAGNRVLLSRGFSGEVLQHGFVIEQWSRPSWGYARIRGRVNRFLPLVSLPEGQFRKRRPTEWEGVKTCNLAVWRADLFRVNGFDERYVGWGHEDADLAVRLIRAGVHRKDGNFATAVLHLWHEENDRGTLPDNVRRLNDIIAGGAIRAKQGLDQYLP